jgi:hypothetical protein
MPLAAVSRAAQSPVRLPHGRSGPGALVRLTAINDDQGFELFLGDCRPCC